MSGRANNGRSSWLFWAAIFPLVVAPIGTGAIVAYTHWQSDRHGPKADHTQVGGPEASNVLDPRVKKDGAKICAAYLALKPRLKGDGKAAPSLVWKELKLKTAPVDPWGSPYMWQPWDRSVRSYGPDRVRETPDDQVVRCDG